VNNNEPLASDDYRYSNNELLGWPSPTLDASYGHWGSSVYSSSSFIFELKYSKIKKNKKMVIYMQAYTISTSSHSLC